MHSNPSRLSEASGVSKKHRSLGLSALVGVGIFLVFCSGGGCQKPAEDWVPEEHAQKTTEGTPKSPTTMGSAYGAQEGPSGAAISESPSSVPHSSQEKQEKVVEEVVQWLVRHGWAQEPAQAVVKLNRRLFELTWTDDREQPHKSNILNLLARLGTRSDLQTPLDNTPELAGLLAGVLTEDEKAPRLIVRSIPTKSQKKQIVLSLYEMYCEPRDASLLAEALCRDGSLIVRLWEHGAWSALPWLITEIPPGEAGQIYHQWIKEALETGLRQATLGVQEDAMDRVCAVLDIHAPRVLKLLQDQPEFRKVFLQEYWPRFSKALDQASQISDTNQRDIQWMLYVAHPGVWEYYHQMRDKAERAFQAFERHGVLAVDLMLASEYRDVRDVVLDVLEDADEEILFALTDDNLRSQPLFPKLLARKVPRWVLAQALRRLRAQPATAPHLLKKWSDLSDSALTEEMGPEPSGPKTWIPGYGIYYWVHKASQGRDLDFMDYVWAITDLWVFNSFGKKALSENLGQLAQSIGSTMANKGIRRSLVVVTEEAIKKGGRRTVAPLVIKEGHKLARTQIQNVLRSNLAKGIEITDAVRWTFGPTRGLGVGRKLFRSFPELEARVFMQGDRRVFIQLGHLLEKNSVLGIVLRESALNAGFDLALQTPVGEQVVTDALKALSAGIESADQKLEAWREHLSAWWMAVYSGWLEETMQSQVPASEPKASP